MRNDAVHIYSLQRGWYLTCNGALGYDEVALDLLRTFRGLASAVQRFRKCAFASWTSGFSPTAIILSITAVHSSCLVFGEQQSFSESEEATARSQNSSRENRSIQGSSPPTHSSPVAALYMRLNSSCSSRTIGPNFSVFAYAARNPDAACDAADKISINCS